MSNSPLVTYTRISSHKNSPRNHVIDTITIHCIVGQWTAKQGCDYFATTDRDCSANYVVGKDGSIGLSVDEKDRSWCSSSSSNDNRAVTIEVASDTTDPYAVTDAAYNALIQLVADICKRNNIKELKWKADKSLIGQVDKQNMTVHRWFANKSCPGEYLYSRHADIAARVNAILCYASSSSKGMQASELAGLSEADAIKKVGALFTADQKESGILASVSAAQFILESGYGKSELSQNANNVFGMKKSLSGNTWNGSSWDGSSIYHKKTQEWDGEKYITITADFRKYSCIEKSIADHSAYLLGAENGSALRYAGLKGCTDYKKAFQIIKNGGYATAPDYVEKLCAIVEKWNLTQYDMKANAAPSEPEKNTFPACPFTVKVIIDDLNYRSAPSMEGKVNGQTGKGVFTIMEVKDGWGRLKSGAGWIYLENPSYCTIHGTVQAAPSEPEKNTFPACPFTVKVIIDDLNYRSAPSMEGKVNGQTGKGVFTIMEVKDGWGRLKSGAGWIYLENPSYCTIHGTVQAAPAEPAKKSVDELAKEVIQGKWGNGQARKDALTAAGYDYNAVQARVNQLMK